MDTFLNRWNAERYQTTLDTEDGGDDRVAGATALVVDDDFMGVFALTVLLERRRMSVVTANSGSVALETLEQRLDVGIVLMDIMMPNMDGYETIAAIRSRPDSLHLPVIAVTARTMPGERERCLAAGATAYVSKPIDTPRLLEAISELLPPMLGAASSS